MSRERAEMRLLLTPQQLKLEEWLYEYTKYPEGVIVLGVMTFLAAQHQEWDFWQVLDAARKRIRQ